jgi:hypothetical protein
MPYNVLTEEQAVDIYGTWQIMRSNSIRQQRGKSVGIAKKFGVSPKAIRDIWERRSWVKETRHLWTETDLPKIRKQAPTPRSEVSNARQKSCRKSMHDGLPKKESCIEINTNLYIRSPTPATPMSCVRSLFPSFAEVTFYGAYCSSRKTHLPSTNFFAPYRPPDCLQSLCPAPTPPSLPAAPRLVPLLAALVLGSTCDGSCGVCGASSGVMSAGGSAMAARDDPFHHDWPHW